MCGEKTLPSFPSFPIPRREVCFRKPGEIFAGKPLSCPCRQRAPGEGGGETAGFMEGRARRRDSERELICFKVIWRKAYWVRYKWLFPMSPTKNCHKTHLICVCFWSEFILGWSGEKNNKHTKILLKEEQRVLRIHDEKKYRLKQNPVSHLLK